MGQTYYDSTLTDAQIQQVLDAINNILTPSNNGKVLAISGGTLEARSVQWGGGGGYPEPSGTILLTQNGIHDVKDYAEANVQVQSGGSDIEVIPLTATANAVYTAPTGKAYSPVTVNVSGGGGDDWANLKNYLESSGTQYINTEYIVQNGDKFEIIAEIPNDQVNYACLFGRRQSTLSKQIYILTKLNPAYVINGQYASSGSNKFMAETVYTSGGNNDANDSRTIADTYNKKIRIVLDGNHFEIHDVNGLLWYSPIATPGDVELNLPMYLFAMNTNGSIDLKCKCKIYLYRVYDINNNIKLEMVATQNNGVACMQDTVSGDYFYNAGAGDFVYGTDA